MGFYKQSVEEKKYTNIIKSYLYLYPYWRVEYNSTNTLHKKELLLLNIIFVETFILNDQNKNILLSGVSTRKKGLEYVAYSLYYSESGLRNKINVLLKDILSEIKEKKFLKTSN